MIPKDLNHYAASTFHEFLEPISTLSKSDNGNVLVEDERNLYNFDKITEEVYHSIKTPSSADALFITDRMILFTEFKRGFKRKISIETLDESKLNIQLKTPDTKDYYYDEIKVFSPYEYKKYLDQFQ